MSIFLSFDIEHTHFVALSFLWLHTTNYFKEILKKYVETSSMRLAANLTTPLWICGNFNSLLEKGDQPVNGSESRDFQQVIDTLILTDMKVIGRVFTWTNGHIWSKIDRTLCKEAWISQYSHITTQFKEKNFWDNSPTHIEITTTMALRRKPFRFLNNFTEDKKFMEM